MMKHNFRMKMRYRESKMGSGGEEKKDNEILGENLRKSQNEISKHPLLHKSNKKTGPPKSQNKLFQNSRN